MNSQSTADGCSWEEAPGVLPAFWQVLEQPAAFCGSLVMPLSFDSRMLRDLQGAAVGGSFVGLRLSFEGFEISSVGFGSFGTFVRELPFEGSFVVCFRKPVGWNCSIAAAAAGGNSSRHLEPGTVEGTAVNNRARKHDFAVCALLHSFPPFLLGLCLWYELRLSPFAFFHLPYYSLGLLHFHYSRNAYLHDYSRTVLAYPHFY